MPAPKLCPRSDASSKMLLSKNEEWVALCYAYISTIASLMPHLIVVQGCDASILLDSTSTIDSEKNANANTNNSARGFEVIDRIKSEVDKICRGPIVSCADILAVAARDSVVALGGPMWEVKLGRRDSTTASKDAANDNLPTPFMDLSELIDNFKKQDLDAKDLVALSGGHTFGFAQCRTFQERIYDDEDIDPEFARQRQANCPRTGGDSNLASLDPTPALFDTKYFNNLVGKKGLLESDQALFSGGQTDDLVKSYSQNLGVFSKDFANSMVKMGDIKPLTGDKGSLTLHCRSKFLAAVPTSAPAGMDPAADFKHWQAVRRSSAVAAAFFRFLTPSQQLGVTPLAPPPMIKVMHGIRSFCTSEHVIAPPAWAYKSTTMQARSATL
nr:cationic peroxidase 1-like [Ipomoea batatas]